MKNFVIVNSKGGVGKTVAAVHVIPILLENENRKRFFYYELDNNNNTEFEQSKFITFKKFKLSNIMDAIDEIEFFDNDINIIDAGGGDDTFNVLKELSESTVKNNIVFIAPVGKDLFSVYNLEKTFDYISNMFEKPEIYLFLNFINENRIEYDEIKKDFVNIFGSEDYVIESFVEKYPDIKFGYITDSYIFQILNLYKTTFIDFLKENFYIAKQNMEESKKDIFNAVYEGRITKEKGFKEFKEFKKTYRLYGKAECLKNVLLKLNKEFVKEFNNGK